MTETADTLESKIGFLVPLNKLSPDRRAHLLAQSEVVSLRKKETLFKQGDRDDYTFYVLDGELEMYADDSLIKRVTGGEGASFQPLAQLQPRQMTAIARSKVEALRIRRSLLDQLLSTDETPPDHPPQTGVEVEEVVSEQSSDWLMVLLRSELFTRIPPSNIQGLLDTLEPVTVSAGEEIVRQGDPGDYYYVIQRGACEVVRTGAKKREITLAELHVGDTFGEEALISGAKRNATVRMTDAGELARLTKDDFTRLIKSPILHATSLAEAEQMVAAGAYWLDVRFEDEHEHNGIRGCLNIPIGTLRTRMDELDPQARYIAYCDSGGRSSAAAFLLAEKGFNVCYVEGGAVSEPLPDRAHTAAEAPPERTASLENKHTEQVVEANARASALGAELEMARLTIEKAQRMMAEAEAMKRESERIVAEKLATERERLDDESEQLRDKLAAAEAMKQESERIVAEKLAAEQRRIDGETEQLRARLLEAERVRMKLTEQQKAAEALVARQQELVEERVKKAEQQAREALLAEEQRLEALYQKQADQLESMHSDREAELRSALSKELAVERAKFEQEVLRTTQALERAQEERRKAVAAKEAAAAEAASLITQFEAQQKALLAEQRAAFEEERKRLTAEAARIETQRQDALRAREAAEAAKQAAERELHEARKRQLQARDPSHSEALQAIEQRASAAERQLQQAVEAETAVNSAARVNEDELERTYDTATEINMLLQKELDEWIGEQDRLQESTLQRAVLSRQKEMVERIKARALSARAEATARTKSLLEEIEEQLQGD